MFTNFYITGLSITSNIVKKTLNTITNLYNIHQLFLFVQQLLLDNVTTLYCVDIWKVF